MIAKQAFDDECKAECEQKPVKVIELAELRKSRSIEMPVAPTRSGAIASAAQ